MFDTLTLLPSPPHPQYLSLGFEGQKKKAEVGSRRQSVTCLDKVVGMQGLETYESFCRKAASIRSSYPRVD